MAYTRGSANYATHAFIKTHFSPTVVAKLDKTCVAADCVNKDWEGEIAEGGDIVRIREFGDITINDYTVDSTLTYQTTSESYQDLVIDQQKYFAFKVDKVDEKQSDLDVINGFAERAAIGLRNTVDTHLLSAMSSGVAADNVIGAAALGSVIQLDKFNLYPLVCDLYTLLEESDVFGATDQIPWLIVTPRIKGIMKQCPEFTPATEMGDKVVRNGVIGEFGGFEVKTTTNQAMTAATGGDDDYLPLLGGVNLATGFAMQINEVDDLDLQTTFARAHRGLSVYGSKVVRAQGLVKAFVKP